ncbi:2og-fe oxygenase family protein [Apiospora marii]|uniref:2og-fe oxygenase family protein n=1 Tax=Apiospora marii TaxID=335849 RepID=A0ABR1RKI2_9PEZI
MPPQRKRTGRPEAKAPKKQNGTGSDQPTTDLSQVLTDFLSSGSNSTFTCGGAISLAELAALRSPGESAAPPSRVDEDAQASKKRKTVHGKEAATATASTREPKPVSITIRWDRPDTRHAKAWFPIADDDAEGMEALDDLVSDCQPAGFGHLCQNVFDKSVRRAGAMDCSRFSYSLCPYELGIINRVTQLLLPNVAGMLPACAASDGFVRAELHKLNVYEGPSGFFKSHVDTPRGPTQFGSLVLCLPSAHTGGRLTVSHAEQESVAYNWDQGNAGDLQWAAFYSDCKHEVHEVTDGRRITITYNLYYERRVSADPLSGLDSKPAPVDVTKLAPYATMGALLRNPEWMKDGGVLGIFCAHAYATTISNVVDLDSPKTCNPSSTSLPSDKLTTFKGTDMSLYAVFRQLGLEVSLVPIIISSKYLPEESYWPRAGIKTKAGMVGQTAYITDETEDAAEIPEAFGKLVVEVKWISQPRWRNLALIHGNVSACLSA